MRYLKENGIPNYIFPEEAVHTLGEMCRFAEILNVPDRVFKEFAVEKDAAEVWRAALEAVRVVEGRHLAEWKCAERFLDAFLETKHVSFGGVG